MGQWSALGLMCLISLIPGGILAIGLTLAGLAIGGILAGVRSRDQGKGFMRGFENYINEEWAQAMAITAIVEIVTFGVGTIARAVANAGSKAKVANSIEGAGKANLLDELANSGVKYNPDDIVMITKNSEGKLMWLENGNDKAGLNHILKRHADDFAAKGVSDIPKFLKRTLNNSPINAGSGSRGLYADYLINNNSYRVAYGTNGFIVSFYPIG